MEYHKDYFIRTIQQFIVVLARILGLIKNDDPAFVQLQIDLAFSTLIGFDKKLFMVMDIDSILRLFELGGQLDADRCYVSGLLMTKESEALIKLGDKDLGINMRERGESLMKIASDRKISEELSSWLKENIDLI